MDRISQSNANKLSSTPCSFSGPQTLPSSKKRLLCVSQIRQHNSGCLYKQARGVRSRSLHTLAKIILLWSRKHLLSLRATHVPGQMNIGADLLSRGNPHLGQWKIHPEEVQEIWHKYGQAKVDLFASEENTHCPLFFSLKEMDAPLGMDALAHPWPETVISFPTDKLYPSHTVQNHITEDEGPPNSPVIAREDMDSRDSSTAVFAFMKSSSAQGSPLSGRGEDFSSTSEEVESLGLAHERSNLNVSITQVFRRSENVCVLRTLRSARHCQNRDQRSYWIVEAIKLAYSVFKSAITRPILQEEWTYLGRYYIHGRCLCGRRQGFSSYFW